MLSAGSRAGVPIPASDSAATLGPDAAGTTRRNIASTTVQNVGRPFQNVEFDLDRHQLFAGDDQIALGLGEPLFQERELGGSCLLQFAQFVRLVFQLAGVPRLLISLFLSLPQLLLCSRGGILGLLERAGRF